MSNLMKNFFMPIISAAIIFAFFTVSGFSTTLEINTRAEEAPTQEVEKQIEFIDVDRDAEEGDAGYHWTKSFIYKLGDQNLIDGYPVGEPVQIYCIIL